MYLFAAVQKRAKTDAPSLATAAKLIWFFSSSSSNAQTIRVEGCLLKLRILGKYCKISISEDCRLM